MQQPTRQRNSWKGLAQKIMHSWSRNKINMISKGYQMKINREARDRARRVKSKPVESPSEDETVDPAHSHQNEENARARSGVVIRNTINHGKSAIDKARSMLEGITSHENGRPRTQIDAGEEWFQENKEGVERLIGQKINVDGKRGAGPGRRLIGECGGPELNTSGTRLLDPDEVISLEPSEVASLVGQLKSDLSNYRPPIDDDAEEYVPKSER